MIDYNKLWKRPSYTPYVQSPLTDEMVVYAEKVIGYSLPKEYIELLKTQNGGYINYRIKDTLHEKIYGIGSSYPSILDFNQVDDDEVLSDLTRRRLFPFDKIGDEEYLCLDYRFSELEPKVTYVQPIYGIDFTIAKSFSYYLKKLTIDTSGKWVLETDISLDKLIGSLNSNKEIYFEQIDISQYGYSNFKAVINDCNIWISSNKVPEYFQPTMELVNTRTSKQFLELLDQFHIISCTDRKAFSIIKKMINKMGVRVTPLNRLISKKLI